MTHDDDRIGTRLGHNALVPDERPTFEPEHQHRITKERWFEFGTVISLIVLGTAFVIWRGNGPRVDSSAPQTVEDAVASVSRAGYEPMGVEVVLGRQFAGFEKGFGDMTVFVDLVGIDPGESLEAAVIWLVPDPGEWAPTHEALHEVVDEVAAVGTLLVPSVEVALEKAVATMVNFDGSGRPHQRGVAQTNNGWKITYVTYREYDDESVGVPALCLVLHRMTAAGDPELEELNRGLYGALNAGEDVKTALRRVEGESGTESL